ncbi:hypothetical protein NF212_12310 [Parasalinivibrio latis]|uniref:hypothetical protein n=1 Tax=Parasalinivibrio latis TaxID=2952610 RepID=UPI0030E0B9E4
MNFRDPELVLIKRFRGGKCSYYQVSSVDNNEVTIKDIEHGGHFSFPRTKIERHILNGILICSTADNVPDIVFVNPVRKREKPKSIRNEARYEAEMERRYSYVKAVLDSSVPAYTEKRLAPWIKDFSISIDDNHPPSWRTLANWVSLFVKSGWKKQSLKPAHASKGNRAPKTDKEVSQLLDQVVREHLRKNLQINYTKAHNDFLLRVEALNQARTDKGLKPLKPSGYKTTVRRLKN